MGKHRPEGIPRNLNHDSMKALLEDHGWVVTIGGKHSTKMEKQGQRPITLPRHKGAQYGVALRAGILRQAGLKGGEDRSEDQDESTNPASGE